MENSERIYNEGSRLVRDTMDPAVHFEEDIKVGDARQALEQQNAPYGVIRIEESTSHVIVTQEQLSIAHEDELVQTFGVNLPQPESVEPQQTLDEIVRTRAGEFANNPALTGIIVQEQGNILGVLPREKIEEHAQILGILERDLAGAPTNIGDTYLGYMGFPVGLLEGAPVSERSTKEQGVPPPGYTGTRKLDRSMR